MRKNPGREAQKRLAHSMGIDEATLEAPFKAMHEWGQQLLRQNLVELTEDERKFALWLIERNAENMRLLEKETGTLMGNLMKSFGKILLWHLKNLLRIKQREMGERDPNRPWNEKYYAYDNDYYRHRDETDRLKVERFGHITPERREHVDHVVHTFDSDAFFNWGRAMEFGERISKRYVEERTALLKKWLANPEGEPPKP